MSCHPPKHSRVHRRLSRRSTGKRILLTVSAATGLLLGGFEAGAVLAAVPDGGTVLYAWGNNNHGQLGDGSVAPRATAEPINLPAGVTATVVAAGGDQSFAIGSDAQLYAWGYNGGGALGDGTFGGIQTTPEVITLAPGVTPTAISAGFEHTLAIGSDGKLYAWGLNNFGQLGCSCSGGLVLTPQRTNLPPGVSAKRISAGNAFSLAIGSDDQLYAWGLNDNGQLGNGTLDFSVPTPAAIAFGPGVTPTAVRAGNAASFAIGSDGNLYGWGNAANGALGDGNVAGSHYVTAPESISLAPGVQANAVAAGSYASMAIGSDHGLYAWGDNFFGEIGDGTTRTYQATPKLIEMAAGVNPTALAKCAASSLAIGTNGTLYAWGSNDAGQLGDGTTVTSASPEPITPPDGRGISAIACGTSHVLAIGAATAPSITAAPDITVSTDPGACGSTLTSYPGIAVRGDPAPTVTANPGAPHTFPVGTTTVVVTAINSVGSATATFNVKVNDTEKPKITAPANLTVDLTSPTGATVTYPAFTATDNCPGVKVTSSPPSGSKFPVGNTTVTGTATDASGNLATASFVVHVNGAAEVIQKITQALKGGTCTGLQALINEVNYLSPAVIPKPIAQALIAGLTAARRVAGCK